MGGGFGGKETQATLWAVHRGAGRARKTGRPCKLRLDRDDDMIITGKRHDFAVDYDVGFDDDGRIRGGRHRRSPRAAAIRPTCQLGVNDRAMFHADNAYFLPERQHHVAAHARPTPCRTPPSAASAGRRA